jgi:hypothetical protein
MILRSFQITGDLAVIGNRIIRNSETIGVHDFAPFQTVCDLAVIGNQIRLNSSLNPWPT